MPGRVDDPAVVAGQRQRHRRRRGVPAPAGHGVDHPDRPLGVGDQPVDQRRLADPGVTDEHGDPAGQVLADLVDPDDVGRVVRVPAGHHVGDGQGGVGGEERVRFDEVGLGEDQQGVEAGVVGGDEAAVDQPRAGLGVGQRGDDDELVGVGDDDPLHGVGVVGAAPQRRLAGLDADDAGQRVRPAGGVADQSHMVADHDALAPQLTGAHRGDHPLGGLRATHPGAEQDRVPAAVDAGDEPGHGVLVGRSGLGAAPRPSRVRADADVGLVEVLPAHRRVRLGRRRRRAWRSRGR